MHRRGETIPDLLADTFLLTGSDGKSGSDSPSGWPACRGRRRQPQGARGVACELLDEAALDEVALGRTALDHSCGGEQEHRGMREQQPLIAYDTNVRTATNAARLARRPDAYLSHRLHLRRAQGRYRESPRRRQPRNGKSRSCAPEETGS